MVEAADFTFNITEGSLTGELDGEHYNSRASSGGRGGTKTQGAEQYFLVNNPFSAGVKLRDGDKASVGGTLPLGRYSLRAHQKRDRIRVEPLPGTASQGRDGLLIHGRGPRGSDGCIVPADFHVVQRLYTALLKREKAGAAAPVLEVIAVGADVDKKLREWRTTA
jgi:hypothetical protein